MLKVRKVVRKKIQTDNFIFTGTFHSENKTFASMKDIFCLSWLFELRKQDLSFFKKMLLSILKF